MKPAGMLRLLPAERLGCPWRVEPVYELDLGSKHPHMFRGQLAGLRARHSDFDLPGACVGSMNFEEVADAVPAMQAYT